MDDDEPVGPPFPNGRNSQKGLQINKGDDLSPDIADPHQPVRQIGQGCDGGPVSDFQSAGKRKGEQRTFQSE